ncbi:HEPN domain-containing protein [Bacillus tropicus]|uniref:HEPN domain-containing protein n=1 Tax=Bacillus tropicus TaxID=2026188 RepID=UPI003D24969A
MNNKVVEKKISDCFQEINNVKETLIKYQFKPLDKEREYFSKYMLIHISGVLEISYKTLISDYCLLKSNVHLHNFFEIMIVKKSKNATISNICEILKSLNSNLHQSFRDNLNSHKDASEIQSAIKSLNTLRHSFAHGILTEKVYLNDIEKYFIQAVKMLDILDEILVNTEDKNFSNIQQIAN